MRKRGILTYITSNKWMRAAYGEKLRKFFSDESQPLTLIDFSGFQVFDTATVDTNVLLLRKDQRLAPVQACNVDTLEHLNTEFIKKHAIEITDLSGDSWTITSKVEYAIKQKIEAVGTPLRDWNITINYGIKTGLNDAFIIDGKKKEELIADDPKSAKIIKPLLRGSDIKRYRAEFADRWLIATFPILNIDINNYPAVRNYLQSFGLKIHQIGKIIGKDEQGNNIKSRKKTGNQWFETQDQISYYQEFEKEKIIYPNMTKFLPFVYDKFGMFTNDKSFILNGKNLRFLIAVLNSTVFKFGVQTWFPTLGKDGYELRKIFFEKVSIPKPTPELEHQTNCLVDYLREMNAGVGYKEHATPIAFFDQLTDGLVYELYFPNEIKAAGKDILPHLGNLTPITDNMNETQKLTIIQNEYNRLNDPNHLIRKHLDTLSDIETIRTIQQSLKR